MAAGTSSTFRMRMPPAISESKVTVISCKEVKVKKDEATVTFTSLSVSFHGAEAAVRTILMSPYGINIDKLKYWNQSDKSNDEKGKGKDLTTKFL